MQTEHVPKPKRSVVSWILQISVALILLQTLFFKFTAHPESKAVFSNLGVEPWGRIAAGALELLVAVLILLPRPRFILAGAILGAGMMMGAILSHFFVIGIASGGDGGLLFSLAVAVLVSCSVILVLRRHEIRLFWHH